MRRLRRSLSPSPTNALAAVLLLFATGCAAVSELDVVRPPLFSHAEDRAAEVRIVAPSATSGAGGAEVRLWAEVTNPNFFALELDRLDGTLFLGEVQAAAVDFPLGLELKPRDGAVVPLDLRIDFDDLSAVARVLRRAIDDREVAYRLEGTIGVDAGPLGGLTFGPMDVLEGELDATVLR